MRVPSRGMRVPGALLIAALLVLSSGPVVADDTAAHAAIIDFELIALENNRELAALEDQLSELEETISGLLLLDNSNLSLSGGYSFAPALVDNPHSVSGSVSASVPVLPQISISGQVASSGSGSLTLSFTPLAAMGASVADEQQLASQHLTIEYKRLEIQWQSRILLLQYAAAAWTLENAEQNVSLGRQQYEYAENQFEAGLISHADFQGAGDDLAARSSNLINALQQESGIRGNLYQFAGTTEIPEEILNIDIETEELLDLISEANAVYLEVADSSVFTSLDRQTMQLQKHFLEAQLDSTWAFEPGLSVSVTGSISDAFDTPAGSAGANVSLQLSAASFKFDEIRTLRDQIADLERDLHIEQIVSVIAEENAKRSLEAAELSAEIAERNLLSLQLALEQAEHDLEQHNISEFEHANVSLSNIQAETSCFNSLIAIYTQLGTLLQSYVDPEN